MVGINPVEELFADSLLLFNVGLKFICSAVNSQTFPSHLSRGDHPGRDRVQCYQVFALTKTDGAIVIRVIL